MAEAKQEKIYDLYFTTRILMMCYGLTCPALILLFFALLYLFPRSNGSIASRFFRKHLIYLKNLSGLGGVTLGIVMIINNILPWFYLVDIAALGNSKKYSVYGIASGSEHPLLVFCLIIGFGYLLYWAVTVISYKRYGPLCCDKSLADILENN